MTYSSMHKCLAAGLESATPTANSYGESYKALFCVPATGIIMSRA
jgi:hypothetical protein